MTFDNWQIVALIFGLIGVAAGLVLASILARVVWMVASTQILTEKAQRLAEKSLLEAQIHFREQQLARLERNFGDKCTEIFAASDAQAKAVNQ